jgi:hypothetical protein
MQRLHDETVTEKKNFRANLFHSFFPMSQQLLQYGPQAAKVAVVGGSTLFGAYWMANNCLYNGMCQMSLLCRIFPYFSRRGSSRYQIQSFDRYR